MPNELTAEKVAEIYEVWLTNRSTIKTGRICGVSDATVRKYVQSEGWAAKADKITQKVVKRIENEAEKRQRRHIQQTHLLQKVGVDSLQGAKLKPAEAIKAIDTGIKLEREILGESDAGDNVTIQIKLPKGMTMGLKDVN